MGGRGAGSSRGKSGGLAKNTSGLSYNAGDFYQGEYDNLYIRKILYKSDTGQKEDVIEYRINISPGGGRPTDWQQSPKSIVDEYITKWGYKFKGKWDRN